MGTVRLPKILVLTIDDFVSAQGEGTSLGARGQGQHAGFVCPRHVCAHSALPSSRRHELLCCTRCPIAYHKPYLPAGVRQDREKDAAGGKGEGAIVCPRHFESGLAPGKRLPSVHGCLLCGEGGELVCCDTCPGCFHVDCLSEVQGFVPFGENGDEARPPPLVPVGTLLYGEKGY